MTRREFDGEAQKRGLQALQKRTGKLPKDIGAALSVDTQTYRRYFWGKRPLRAIPDGKGSQNGTRSRQQKAPP